MYLKAVYASVAKQVKINFLVCRVQMHTDIMIYTLCVVISNSSCTEIEKVFYICMTAERQLLKRGWSHVAVD